MGRGRKTLPPAERVGAELETPDEFTAEESTGKALDLGALEQATNLIQVGRIQVHDFAQKLHRVSAAKEFQRLRESNGYKGLPYRDQQGNLKRVSDLEEFCEVFIGRTYRSVHDDAQNLAALGDELYEHALALGLTTRNFRDMRALAQDDQQLVREAIASKNRDEVIELLEHAINKHAKEKRTLEKQLKNTEADLEAQRNVTAKKNQKLDELETTLHRRQADLPAQLQELQIACVEYASSALNAINSFTQLRLKLPDMPEFADRKDEIVAAVGATCTQSLYQVQAWLSEEIKYAELTFYGAEPPFPDRGPGWDDEKIAAMQDAGAKEARRVLALDHED